MILEKGTTVAEIEIWKSAHEQEVHHVKLVGEKMDHIECNNTTDIPDFITDNEGLNKEEQQEAFMKNIKFGYHHPSMTKQVEEKAALTEISLQKVEPSENKDLADQFEFNHLSDQAQKHLEKVVRKQKDAFSKHPFD